MALLVAGAVVFVLGTAFVLASDATLPSSSPGASGDLAQAGHWLQFLAAVCLLGAVCTAGWEVILRSEWVAGAEIAAAALGTLLLMTGLAAFAASNGSSPAAPVTGAVGIGVWALLVLSRAARASLAEQGPAHGAVEGAGGAVPVAAAAGGRRTCGWPPPSACSPWPSDTASPPRPAVQGPGSRRACSRRSEQERWPGR